jgi:hypothetical protein
VAQGLLAQAGFDEARALGTVDDVDAFCHVGSPCCLVIPASCAGRNRFGFSSLSDRLQFAIEYLFAVTVNLKSVGGHMKQCCLASPVKTESDGLTHHYTNTAED